MLSQAEDQLFDVSAAYTANTTQLALELAATNATKNFMTLVAFQVSLNPSALVFDLERTIICMPFLQYSKPYHIVPCEIYNKFIGFGLLP